MKYNFLIITSSYPAISKESFEGGCVESFAEALSHLGHNVIVLTQCVGKNYYKDSEYFKINRFKWYNDAKPLSTLRISRDVGKIYSYFAQGISEARKIARKNKIDFTICAWALPAGVLGLYLQKRYAIPYVIWALGSDIWQHASLFLWFDPA